MTWSKNLKKRLLAAAQEAKEDEKKSDAIPTRIVLEKNAGREAMQILNLLDDDDLYDSEEASQDIEPEYSSPDNNRTWGNAKKSRRFKRRNRTRIPTDAGIQDSSSAGASLEDKITGASGTEKAPPSSGYAHQTWDSGSTVNEDRHKSRSKKRKSTLSSRHRVFKHTDYSNRYR